LHYFCRNTDLKLVNDKYQFIIALIEADAN
jgi:hypothetical protein